MKWQNGTVRWFDNISGEGYIRVGEKSIYVHWSAIAKHMKGLPTRPFIEPKSFWCCLFRNQKVKVQVLEDYSFIQISGVKT